MDITMRNHIATPTLTALTESTAKALDWTENDDKLILVINNTTTSATTITVKAGNGLQA